MKNLSESFDVFGIPFSENEAGEIQRFDYGPGRYWIRKVEPMDGKDRYSCGAEAMGQEKFLGADYTSEELAHVACKTWIEEKAKYDNQDKLRKGKFRESYGGYTIWEMGLTKDFEIRQGKKPVDTRFDSIEAARDWIKDKKFGNKDAPVQQGFWQ